MATAPKTAPKGESKEVATTKAGGVPALDFGDDAGRGYEGQTAADIVIPFVNILQGLSPQVAPVKKGGIEGAEVGMLFNVATQELFDGDTGMVIVPAYFDRKFVEWVPREAGGGFVAQHEPGSDLVVAAQEQAAADGVRDLKMPGKGDREKRNDLIETMYVYATQVSDDDENNPVMNVVFSFTSTKITVWRNMNTQLRACKVGGVTPPLFANRLRIGTKEQHNNQGDFYNFRTTPFNKDTASSLIGRDHPAYAAAKSLRGLVEEGKAKVQERNREPGDDDGERGSGNKSSGKAPF